MTSKTGFRASVLVLVAVASGCAFAPISNDPSGRTVGAGHFAIEVSGIPLGGSFIPDGKILAGLTDDFDLGAEYDELSIGLFAKYSFINPVEDGPSFALVAGGGASLDGGYAYIGPMFGVKLSFLEPYLGARFNYITYGSQEVGSDQSNDLLGDFTVPAGNYSYFSATAGVVLWAAPWMGIKAEVTGFSGGIVSTGIVNSVVFDGGFIFRPNPREGS